MPITQAVTESLSDPVHGTNFRSPAAADSHITPGDIIWTIRPGEKVFESVEERTLYLWRLLVAENEQRQRQLR